MAAKERKDRKDLLRGGTQRLSCALHAVAHGAVVAPPGALFSALLLAVENQVLQRAPGAARV